MRFLWRKFWSIVWDASEFSGVSLGRFAPWVMAQMIGCKNYWLIEQEETVKRTYEQAAHAMQTGVAYKMEKDASETDPKHLRVGVNSAMVGEAALAALLIEKGFITVDEYREAATRQMNEEADNYEREVNELYGADGRIKLG